MPLTRVKDNIDRLIFQGFLPSLAQLCSEHRRESQNLSMKTIRHLSVHLQTTVANPWKILKNPPIVTCISWLNNAK